MKHAKLGLPQERGVHYTIAPDGRILATKDGTTTTLKKLKLDEPKEYLYFIDPDGDLSREWRVPPREQGLDLVRVHPTRPASSKLRARDLYQRIDALLFPETWLALAHSGHVENEIEESREIYEKEHERLATEISIALGPGVKIESDAFGWRSPGYVWWLRDRAVVLTLEWEDKEYPGDIRLSVASSGDVKRALAARKKSTKTPSKKSSTKKKR